MTSNIFAPHKNIIKHTMAHADKSIEPQHQILSAGTEVTFLDVGVIKFEPNTACDTSLVISCAVHGNETAPIEIISKIIDDLLAEDQKSGQRVLFILGNPWAMIEAERFIDVNMNRLFCGDWQQHEITLKEVKRAAKLEAYVANFFAEEPVTVTQRMHYDCHTAIRDSAREKFAVYPFVSGRTLPESQKAFLARADVQTVLLQQQEANTFSSFSALKYNAESFTLELGKVMPFGANNLKQFVGIDYALRELIAGEPLPDAPKKQVDSFVVCHEIEKTSDNWQFNIPDSAANFSAYPAGFTVWQDGDQAYQVQNTEEFVVFPNPKVPVGQRAGLMLKKIITE
ncbi:succinylglutamate desuccinylase [Reinekea sp.]|jgi:succinylglutamate desuccinylase|uniref:succinylglutamate desuccinylase n=1 Tax=Reinekea sp. TaxID=1970455 RepID=UPI003988D315